MERGRGFLALNFISAGFENNSDADGNLKTSSTALKPRRFWTRVVQKTKAISIVLLLSPDGYCLKVPFSLLMSPGYAIKDMLVAQGTSSPLLFEQ